MRRATFFAPRLLYLLSLIIFATTSQASNPKEPKILGINTYEVTKVVGDDHLHWSFESVHVSENTKRYTNSLVYNKRDHERKFVGYADHVKDKLLYLKNKLLHLRFIEPETCGDSKDYWYTSIKTLDDGVAFNFMFRTNLTYYQWDGAGVNNTAHEGGWAIMGPMEHKENQQRVLQEVINNVGAFYEGKLWETPCVSSSQPAEKLSGGGSYGSSQPSPNEGMGRDTKGDEEKITRQGSERDEGIIASEDADEFSIRLAKVDAETRMVEGGGGVTETTTKEDYAGLWQSPSGKERKAAVFGKVMEVLKMYYAHKPWSQHLGPLRTMGAANHGDKNGDTAGDETVTGSGAIHSKSNVHAITRRGDNERQPPLSSARCTSSELEDGNREWKFIVRGLQVTDARLMILKRRLINKDYIELVDEKSKWQVEEVKSSGSAAENEGYPWCTILFRTKRTYANGERSTEVRGYFTLTKRSVIDLVDDTMATKFEYVYSDLQPPLDLYGDISRERSLRPTFTYALRNNRHLMMSFTVTAAPNEPGSVIRLRDAEASASVLEHSLIMSKNMVSNAEENDFQTITGVNAAGLHYFNVQFQTIYSFGSTETAQVGVRAQEVRRIAEMALENIFSYVPTSVPLPPHEPPLQSYTIERVADGRLSWTFNTQRWTKSEKIFPGLASVLIARKYIDLDIKKSGWTYYQALEKDKPPTVSPYYVVRFITKELFDKEDETKEKEYKDRLIALVGEAFGIRFQKAE